jgi:hypothetical protein
MALLAQLRPPHPPDQKCTDAYQHDEKQHGPHGSISVLLWS